MILSPSRRVRKAYWTAIVVYFSYFWLSLRRRFMGRKWYQSRIVALHIRNAERVKTAILELEGLFIKVGQLLSVMSNFLPEEFQKPLEALQDRLPARPFGEVRRRIEEELGRSPETIFQQIEEIPMATASIGQAHRAVLPDGTEVVVKVQHYGIETIASVDLRILHRLTKIYAWLVDIKGMEYLYSQIRQMIEEEMDFTNEANTMERIRQNLVEEPEVQIPQLFAEYSTRRVMVTRFCTGAKISDLEQLDAWGVDRRALAARLLRVWCRMVFKDGFYHADPHPGNILVSPDGSITLLDFGATANLSPQIRKGITQLIESAIKNDTEGMIEACRTMGFLAEGQDAERMAKKLIGALRNFLQNEIQFEGLDFRNIKVNPFNNSLTDLITEIGFRGIAGTVQMPKDYVLLNRTITLLLGLCNTLDPTYNPLETVRPYAQKYLMQDKGGPLNYVRELLQSTLTSVLALPDEVQKTLKKVRAGEVEIRTPDIEAGAQRLIRVLRQLVLAVLAIGLGFFSLRLWEMGWQDESRWGFWGAGALMLWAIWGRR
ncbi:MAG: AarF/ABC1/UbiB kinase family protein [Saprospiraceae bacterium]|nr:AarF/ABC1/UbiB kinase family protein [Saprospiraceae bacterium]